MLTPTTQHMTDAVQAIPPLAVGGMVWFGIPLQTWVLLATFIYTVILILAKLRQIFFSRRRSDHDPLCADQCALVQKLYNENGRKPNADD